MKSMLVSERRAEAPDGSVPKVSFPLRVSRTRAWIFVVIGACLTGFADLTSGVEVWFGPIYLLIIGFAAWSLGWREAIGVGVASMAMTLSANGFNIYPYGTVATFWNLAMRFVAVLMIIGLLDNARTSYAREWRLARTDPLTSALNRQAFFELAGAAPRSRSWNLLAYSDLDGMKKLNDEQGHDAGDHYLKAYAAHVMKVIRKDDVFARIGGDEFLVYMRVKDEEAAKAVATRLHLAMNTVTSQMVARLRCSIGVLILPPGDRSIDRELQLADDLMYDAKESGAALTVATALAWGESRLVIRHWELDQSFEDDRVPVSSDDRLALRLAGAVDGQTSQANAESERAQNRRARKTAA